MRQSKSSCARAHTGLLLCFCCPSWLILHWFKPLTCWKGTCRTRKKIEVQSGWLIQRKTQIMTLFSLFLYCHQHSYQKHKIKLWNSPPQDSSKINLHDSAFLPKVSVKLEFSWYWVRDKIYINAKFGWEFWDLIRGRVGSLVEAKELNIFNDAIAMCAWIQQGMINPMTFLNRNERECCLFLFHVWTRKAHPYGLSHYW